MTEEEVEEEAEAPDPFEQMAIRYSKRWNVPLEEARKKVKTFLENKPQVKVRGAPSLDDLFPEPLGPISAKVQDVSQAALSTLLARKKMREMNQPPEAIKGLTERMDTMEQSVNQVVELVNTTMADWKKTIEDQQKKEEKEELIKDIETRVIGPLKEELDLIKQAKGGDAEAKGKLTPETVFETVKKMEDEAKTLLKRAGFEVKEPEKFSKAEIENLIEQRTQSLKTKWEEESGAQVQIEEARIKATEDILTNITNRVFDIFLEPIRAKINEAIEKGAFTRPRAPT